MDPKRLKICIVGAGAIGGLLGVRLSAIGRHDVTMIARGAHLQAMKENGGLELRMNDGAIIKAPNATYTSLLSTVPPQDIIFLAVKEHQIEALVPDLEKMFTLHTMIVTLQNGVPWWFFQRYNGPRQELLNRPILAVDPNRALINGIDPQRLVGCVVYPAAHIESPGLIVHTEGMRFPVGELDGNINTERLQILTEALSSSGFKSFPLEDIRSEMWLKLWGSVAFNPISALTHATLVDMCTDTTSLELIQSVMKEAEQVGLKLGIKLRVPMERRIEGAAKVGKHKTSMAQDVENGKPMEIEALIGAIRELGKAVLVDTPHIDTIYACVILLEKVMKEEQVAFQPVKL